MKIIISFLLFVCSFQLLCYSQIKMIDPATVPTPNQSSLGTYGTIPISPYTGKAEIRIPLYSMSIRDVNLDLHLAYDTSGLLINQLPGWTGHNWTLMAGGAVTRKINGCPDEIDYKGTNTGRDLFILMNESNPKIMTNGVYNEYFIPKNSSLEDQSRYDDLRRTTIRQEKESAKRFQSYKNYFQTTPSNRNEYLADSSLNLAKLSKEDSSADIFYFNFMGISGCFFYGNDGQWKVQSDKNILVCFDVDDSSNYIDPFEPFFICSKSDIIQVKQPRTIKGFTLIDEEGNRYVFGGDTSSIEYSMPLASRGHYNTTQPWNAVSWMLRKVENRFGKTLYSFNYSRGSFIAQVQNTYSELIVTETSHDALVFGGKHSYPKTYTGTLNAPVYLDSIQAADGTELVFDHHAVFKEGASDFLYPNGVSINELMAAAFPRLTYGDKYNYWGQSIDPVNPQYRMFMFAQQNIGKSLENMNLEVLSKIKINNKRNADRDNSKEFSFIYSYMGRMHLAALIVNNETKYTFDYNHFNLIPSDYLTKQFDFWGYYNGIDYDELGVSLDTIYDASSYLKFANSNIKTAHIPNFEYGQLGMLNKITYPMGGYSILEYEQNTCSKYLSDDKSKSIDIHSDIPVGGLRIRRITDYDRDSVLGWKEYAYDLPHSNLSSGELYSLPNARSKWEYDYTSDGNSYHRTYELKMACSVLPLSNSCSTSIGYSRVREKQSDGTTKVYTFSNFSTEKDEMYLKSVVNTLSPYNEMSSRRYMCGKLTSETLLDKGGDTIACSKYRYASDKRFNAQNFVVTTSLSQIDGFAGAVGSVYKLFYFNTGVENTTSFSCYNRQRVKDETWYERKHIPIEIKSNRGKSFFTNIFKTVSKTTQRCDMMVKDEYMYPFDEKSETCISLLSQFCFPSLLHRRYINGRLSKGTKVVYGNFNGYALPQYAYSFQGNESKVVLQGECKSYYPDFQVKEMIDGNGVSYKYKWNKYDELEVSIANGSDEITLNGNIQHIKEVNSSEIFATKAVDTQLFTYDKWGRIIHKEEKQAANTHYYYDTQGRLIGMDMNEQPRNAYSYFFKTDASYSNEEDEVYSSSTIPFANCLDGVINIHYQLKYDVREAEVKLYYYYSDTPSATAKIPVYPRKGIVKIPKDKSWRGAYKLYLYINGKFECEANNRLGFQ